MGKIVEDSNKLLRTIYNKYANSEEISPVALIDATNWDGQRINLSLNYLRKTGLIDIIPCMGNVKEVQNFVFKEVTPSGIEDVESAQTSRGKTLRKQGGYKKSFNVGINLGVVQFGGGVEER